MSQPTPLRSSPIDPGFTTHAMRGVWSADSLVSAMLTVEAVHADACAAVGLCDESVGVAIDARCALVASHLQGRGDEVLAEGWEIGTPVLALLARVRDDAPAADWSAWLHHGLTTQDVVDTAMMRRSRDAIELLTDDLARCGAALDVLDAADGRTAVLARTFLQGAGETTFGARVASWRAGFDAAARALALADAGCAVQLGGAVGDRHVLGAHADAIERHWAAALGLAVAGGAWHGDRTRVDDVVRAVAAAASAAARCAGDLLLLASTGIAEVRMRAGGSSAIPNKANPIDAMRAVAAARVCAAAALAAPAAGAPVELERGAGAWLAERWTLPMVCCSAGAALEATARALAGASLDRAVAQRNLDLWRNPQ